ncbi:hypothetical protein BS47DRAFT_1373700 [Hydnum rufescens UP504]|uniref:Uncharacterized protein n=1 Tax=Hydnum rufescens UP504 TaxID=1448309 RepID=A0A9P6AM68_9AGAM|nr:hypothetical protein BS47DRAFT_1373700 [Hydnum rufescens UP504]
MPALSWCYAFWFCSRFFAFLSDSFEAQASTSRLSFHVASGGNDNYFLRDNVTSAQMLITSANATGSVRRLVVAFPAGNSGALVYFLPMSATQLPSITTEYGNVGVEVQLAFNRNATVGVTIIGAVRALRVEASGAMHDIFNYTLHSYNSTFVRLHRQYINSTGPGSTIYRGADLYLSSADIKTQISPVPATALTSLATREYPVAEQISFLTYTDKFTAGGWHLSKNAPFRTGSFSQYFGRDSLIALRLLMPLLTSDAIESALGAVIERANATGALCHEETIGDYASFVDQWLNNRSYLGNQPFYDYKVCFAPAADIYYLYLLPVMSHYFLELPSGKNRAPQFLTRNATLQNGTYGEILNRSAHATLKFSHHASDPFPRLPQDINYNINRAIPFYLNQTHSNLLAFRPGEPVGNWRDSNEGTGYGRIPFDVNTALVPANLRATATARKRRRPLLIFFEVDLDGATAETRLQNFVTQANLSQALLTSSNPQPPPSKVSFYALSLMTDGTPVEILHSDLGFNLVFGTSVTRGYLTYVIDALQPYPRGLLTNIGMVVANPAYDSNTTNINVLNRGAYHGTVVWLGRQLGYCSDSSIAVDTNPPPSPIPSWCSDKAFIDSVRLAQSKLWASIRGAKENIYSEVWSYSFNNATNSFSPADLASLSPTGTESDAIQLWSYGFLALLDPSRILHQ